ncbi:MAG: class I SAM-dependent methyltransferase [Clostridiales bacterium]|nr:class I SAM-dependent methyltransferase [Clostridiales bacterium]
MRIFDDVNNWQKTEGAELFSAILNKPDPVILDYGCGAGTYSFAAAYAFDQKCKVYAVDINKQCLDYIDGKAKNDNISCIITAEGREDCRHEFDDNTFDLVLYADIFHGEGKPYEGLHRFVMVEEAKRTLKEGGILAVLPFHLSNFRDKDKKKCKYTYKKLIDEISEYGFKYVEKDLQGIHFEKVYSPYYQQKGGVTFESLERGKMLIFTNSQLR